jgi:hypothetical protein
MENTKLEQKLLKALFEKHLAGKDVENVEAAMNLAKSITIPNTIRYRACILLGDHYSNPRGYHIAFQYYISASKCSKSPTAALLKAAVCLNNFFWDNELEFSLGDLQNYFVVVEPIYAKLKRSSHHSKETLAALEEAIGKINYRINYTATDIIESKVKARVAIIKSAYYTDMTYDEMETEAARLIARMIMLEDDDEEIENTPNEKEDSKKEPKEKDKKENSEDEKD